MMMKLYLLTLLPTLALTLTLNLIPNPVSNHGSLSEWQADILTFVCFVLNLGVLSLISSLLGLHVCSKIKCSEVTTTK